RAAGHRGGRRGDGGRDLAVLLLPARVPVRRVRTPGAERSRCRGPRELPLLPSRSRPGPGPSSLTVAELAELHGLIVEEGKLRARGTPRRPGAQPEGPSGRPGGDQVPQPGRRTARIGA